MQENIMIMVMCVEAGLLLWMCFEQKRLYAMIQNKQREKEQFKQLKREIESKESTIPVVKFQKQKDRMAEKPDRRELMELNNREKEVLQEMIEEYFEQS